jgi:HK97 family phage major capsid protein
MNAVSREQERIIRQATDSFLRRTFSTFNANVSKVYLRFADLVNNLSRGLYNHDQSRMLQEAAERHGQPYDATKPFVPFELCRDLTAAVDTNLISAAEVVEPASILKPYSVTAQLGIEIDTGLQGNVVVPWVSTASTGYWLANEASTITETAPVVSAKTLKPKQVGAFCEISRQLALQTNAERFVGPEMLRTVGTLIDQAVLAGATANNQPEGLRNATGLQILTGTSLTGASANSMLQLSADEDAPDDSIAFLGTPTVRKVLQGREKASGNGFVWDDNQVAGRPARVTKDLPAGSLVVGPWPEIYLGIWGGFVLEVNPFGQTQFRAGVIQCRVLVSCDVAIRNPGAFVWTEGVT